MAKPTPLKQSIIDSLRITVQKEMINIKYSQHERRLFLMVETALAGGESAFAELLLRNWLGKFDLANTLTWINQEPIKSNLNVYDPESFWTD